jgi:hypothetical protein
MSSITITSLHGKDHALDNCRTVERPNRKLFISKDYIGLRLSRL